MLIKVNPHNGLPVYRQIYDQIHRRIISGRIQIGDKLPSVRFLSVRLKVNPMTISKVYSYLERDGFVERRRGVGLFVLDVAERKKNEDSQTIVSELADKVISAAIELGVSKQQLVTIISQKYDNISKDTD